MARILIVFAALITMGTAANATTLAAGPILGGITQNNAVCILYNAGDSAVTVSGMRIASEFVGSVPQSFNGCGTLAPGGVCNFQANIVNNLAHACKVVISPDGAAVRGDLIIRNGSIVLQSEQLR